MIVGIVVLIAIGMLTAPNYAFRDEIVAAWPLDEGAGNKIHDLSGKGNQGELIGGAEWVDGKFGKALNFDGSSGYIEIPFSESMRVINQGDFTFAAWFMPDEIPPENKEVFQQGDKNGTGRTWLFVHSSNEIRSYLGGGPTQSGIGVKGGEWYHTAVVVTEDKDNDTVQLYVNGELAGNPSVKSMEDSDGNYFIGCHKNLTNFWDGIIDEAVLISKALTEAEVKDLMTNGIMSVLDVEPADKLATVWSNIKTQ